MSLTSTIKHAIFTDDDPVVKPVIQQLKPIPGAQNIQPSTFTAMQSERSIANTISSSIDLRARVQGPAVSIYLAAFESVLDVISDNGARHKMAMAVVRAQGYSDDALIGELTGTKVKLSEEINKFEQAKAIKISDEVTSRESKIKDLSSQIQKLSDELETEKSKIGKKSADFGTESQTLTDQYNLISSLSARK